MVVCHSLIERTTQVAALLIIFCVLVISPAHAQTLGQTLCGILSTNRAALSAIASLGIILLGIGATLGRITWKQALLVAIGIAALFGASAIAFSIASTTDVDGSGAWTLVADYSTVQSYWCSR